MFNMYQSIPIQIAGPSYESRSKPLSSQRTVNLYPQQNQVDESYTLMSFPGLKVESGFNDNSTGRGLTRMKEKLYRVKGGELFEVGAFGGHTSKGEISNNDKCIFSNDGVNLFIVTNGEVYVYSSDTDLVKDLTSFFNAPVLSVDYINEQFLFTLSFATVMTTFDNVTKTLSSIGEIDAITRPDDLVRDFVFEQTIWRCGVRTMEAWYNSGAGTPPISRIEGQIFDTGLAAIHSISQNDDAFYWLGSDYSIYRARGGTKERISHDGISNKLSKIDVSNAVGNCFTLEGQNFYSLKVGNLTYAVNESLGQMGWFELSSGLNGDAWQGVSIIDCYGKLWVDDQANGNIYTLDLDAFTNNSLPIRRERVTVPITGAIVGVKGKRIQMSRVEFTMESGVGLITGQGEDPKLIIEASYDGGKTWAHEGWAELGRLGDNTHRVEWFNISNFTEIMIRISLTDPVPLFIYSGVIDLKLGGR